MSSTKRRIRYALRTDCMVTVDGRLVGETTVDGSWDGLQVLASGPARIGEKVQVALRLPRSRFWIQATGRITRSSPGRRRGDAGPSYGVRLENMHGMDRMLFNTSLRSRPRVKPQRGRRRNYANAVERITREA
ncbi:MAG: PilZ domain-containing protein [Sandaracinaceae bacterium]